MRPCIGGSCVIPALHRTACDPFPALLCWVQAVTIPDFSVVMAFIGSVPSNIMAFFLPALFHLIICWRVMGFWGRYAALTYTIAF